MLNNNDDLIYALATPVGGAIAVIRMSGNGTRPALSRIFTGKIKHRYASFGRIMDGDEIVDEAIAVFFASPQSYTGEDMAEISVHGSQAIVNRVMELVSQTGARCARGGEFTERAFLNGKMDLAQAESVMDIINSVTERSAKSAMEQLQGKLSARILNIENMLLDALSGINAAIDYPEELEDDVFSKLPQTLESACFELSRLIMEGLSARVLREGVTAAIIGLPNAGKSSLLNALLGTNRAIVTEAPGTTRDTIIETVSICKIPVRLMDTAGMRDTDDEAERIGVSLAKKAAEDAELALIVIDGAKPLCADEEALLKRAPAGRKSIAVICKSDKGEAVTAAAIEARFNIEALAVSSLTGEGIEELKIKISEQILPNTESPAVTNMRHIEALKNAEQSVTSAMAANEPECAATDIRNALAALGSITGKEVDPEIIDRIFSRFCVGK